MTSTSDPTGRSIRFYFDFISPYAYLAWTQIHGIASTAGSEVEPVPVLFAGLLAAHGTRGPAEVPARRRYMIKDVVRLARHFGVPLELPPAHPFNPLLALRLASLETPKETKRSLVDALFSAVWRDHLGVTDPATVAQIAAKAGLDPRALDEANAPENKARLKRQTDDAIALGIFGVPTMLAGGELFWGCDSLPHLRRSLAGENAVSPDLLERWERLPAQSERRR